MLASPARPLQGRLPICIFESLHRGHRGNALGFRADTAAFYSLYERRAGPGEWFAWLFSDAAPALLCGLLVIAFLAAAIGYVVADLGWRWWQGRKWQKRGLRPGREPTD